MTSLLDCGNTLPLSLTRHVASNQSADMSAHSKSAFRMPPGQRVAPARRTKLGDDGNQMQADLSRRSARRTELFSCISFWDGRLGQLAFEFFA